MRQERAPEEEEVRKDWILFFIDAFLHYIGFPFIVLLLGMLLRFS